MRRTCHGNRYIISLGGDAEPRRRHQPPRPRCAGGLLRPGLRQRHPAHPSRCFTGVERVRKNWSLIFAAVPDLEAEVVRRVCEADTVWTEWEMRGTRVDGSRHLMRGVTIFGVKQGRFEWVRFYLEPVDGGAAGVDQALRQQLGR